jgi:hypothetical protein
MADEFRALFDGKSLAGWEGNQQVFRVHEGAIVGGSVSSPVPRNEFLCTTRQYGDFEVLVKVKTLGKGANGGIQLRSERIPDHHEMIGYQADVGEGWWGKLYDESRRARVLAGPADEEKVAGALKADDWNQYRIRCQGRRIQLWLNEIPTVDYTEPDASIPQRGLIGLQIHGGPPSEVWYRDIQLRELEAKDSAPP